MIERHSSCDHVGACCKDADGHPPRKKNRESFAISDRAKALELPRDGQLVRLAGSIESTMKTAATGDVRASCAEFLGTVADFYKVAPCAIRVLAARPLRVREYSTTELFGDYHPSTVLIRVWTKTVVRKEITSFGTVLSALCHELSSRLPSLRISGLLADSRFLRAGRCALPSFERSNGIRDGFSQPDY